MIQFIKKFGLDRYYKDSFAEIRQLKDNIENINQIMMNIDRNIENKNISANSVSKLLEITKQDLSHKRYLFLEREIFNIDFRKYIQKLRSYLVDKREKPEINSYIFNNFISKIVIGNPSRDNINIVKMLMQNANNKNLNGKAENSFTIADRNLYIYNVGEELGKTEVTFKIDVDLYY